MNLYVNPMVSIDPSMLHLMGTLDLFFIAYRVRIEHRRARDVNHKRYYVRILTLVAKEIGRDARQPLPLNQYFDRSGLPPIKWETWPLSANAG